MLKCFWEYIRREWSTVRSAPCLCIACFLLGFLAYHYIVLPIKSPNVVVQIGGQSNVIDPKQEIRGFLDSLGSDLKILDRIDKGEDDIRILINETHQTAFFILLSKIHDFDKFLDYDKGDKLIANSDWLLRPQFKALVQDGWVCDSDEAGGLRGFYFYPKDALRR